MDKPQPSSTNDTAPTPGQSLAITAEGLYLANLLLAPGFAFLVLLWLYTRRLRYPELARHHICQTVSASLWAGIMLVVVNIVIIASGGYDSPYVWMIVLIYFTVCHSALTLLGIVGLALAMAGSPVRYPLPTMVNCSG